MGKPFDATGKGLVELAPADWLAFLGAPRPADRVALVDADVSTVTAAADKVIRVADDPPWLLHLELQTWSDGTLPPRMLAYNALLQNRHGLPVASVVVLLRKDANATAITGTHRVEPPFGPGWEFRYTVVRMWEVPVDAVLNGPPAALPLAPLCDVRADQLGELAARMRDRIAGRLPQGTIDVLWAAVAVFLRLRYDPMEADVFYRGIDVDLGRQFMAESFNRNNTRRLILLLGKKRFGPPPAEADEFLNRIGDQAKLDDLAVRVLNADSWDDLLKPV